MPGTVLVADDDEDIRHALVEVLTEEGYSVLEAKDGEEALSMALERSPAVIVLDHRMPGQSGAEVVRRLREGGRAIPVVLMTAGKDVEVLELGLPCLLRKPFGLEELVKMVRQALEGGC